MDLENTQNNSLAKLPLLKQDGTSTTTIPGAVTAEQKILKKNDLKARSILMMTLLSEIITLEELNLKFLRSLPAEWGHSSTNDVNTANVHVSNGSTPVSTASTNNSTACLSDAIEYILLGMTKAKDSEVCKITRAGGSSSFHGYIQALLRRLNRQDLSQLYSLVQERFKDHPLEGHDLDLWGDLRMIFDPYEEDDIWLNQQYWELLRWKLHEYGGVHSLFLDGTSIQINMLVENKYPLKKAILEKMINLKIEAEEESTMAHELIKFIKSQIAERSYL
ncbi:hypothetical protein Tco_0858998 [Tanacetum coccineum]|uniref:Uncharacterized protein n=1 Tax=Tanacetum coccineum TaxID=301880 RepID=A0ABQ5BEG3_9ASTR